MGKVNSTKEVSSFRILYILLLLEALSLAAGYYFSNTLIALGCVLLALFFTALMVLEAIVWFFNNRSKTRASAKAKEPALMTTISEREG